jgi:hypothetical protein
MNESRQQQQMTMLLQFSMMHTMAYMGMKIPTNDDDNYK